MFDIKKFDEWMNGDTGRAWWSDRWFDFKYEETNLLNSPFGTVRFVAEFGGEGQGDDFWVVVSVTTPDGSVHYVKKPGYYASYDGGTLDGEAFEVTPREKVVTVFE